MKFKKLIPYIFVFLTSFFISLFAINSFIKKANNFAEQYVDQFQPSTSQLPNGIYQGKFNVYKFFTFSKVEFEIKNGSVIKINFNTMYHSPGIPYKEEIENQIKISKKLEVDGITGATRTSNFAKAAIKSAIENENIKIPLANINENLFVK